MSMNFHCDRGPDGQGIMILAAIAIIVYLLASCERLMSGGGA